MTYPLTHYWYFYCRRWQKKGVWQDMNNALRQKVLQQEGREHEASAGSADSQSVKTTEKKGQVCGFDGGKLLKGRKRHLVVDT